ncbi:MAG: M56 family metallopeptidase, partial [Planctomycetota bacterium]
LLIQVILRGRLPIRWQYCLWLLLLIRMATPWLPESKISIFNWVPRSIQQGRIIEPLLQPQDARGMGFYSRAGMAEAHEAEPETAIVRFARMVPLLWLLGGAALAVYVGAANFRLWWLVTRERPLTDQKVLDLLEDCKAEMGIRNILGVVTTDKVSSAALFGFLRPRLLLPAGMIETLSLKELRYVFLHELGHLRRRDIYIGWLTSLLQVLHWFNPLVWFAFYRMQSDRELACDALVLTYTRSGESKDYGRTIVSLLERFSRPQRLPSMAGILETKSQLKRRIKMIAKFKKTSRPRWAGAMLLLAALACVVLTNAYVAKADFTFGEPVNIGPPVNTSAGEYGPNVSADGLSLYFSSNRTGGSGGWDIWVTTRATTNTDWSTPINLGVIVNTSADEGRPSISADSLSLYYETNRSGGSGSWDIWVTTRATTEHDWGTPVNLGPTVNSSTVDSGPSISADGLSLFFESGRPGFGLGDIWVATRATIAEQWGPPVNLGSPINTSDFDVQPSISADGMTLFFTSNRSGNLDLWVTTRATIAEQWGPPINLGSVVNSSADDVFPCISADGKTLYFNSSRPGGVGSYDLWQVSILPVVDLNGDGKVDFKDFRKLAQYWGQNEPSCDIAPPPFGDGIVDDRDLMVLAEYLLKELQPIAHWKLDETQGSVAEDSVGSNNGTLHGNSTWQPTGGAVGGALQLDGTDDYVSTPFILDPARESFSVSAWIRGGTPGQVIISQTDSSGSAWLLADASYGRLMTRLMHPPFDPLVSEAVITDGQWHHIGLVYDLETLRRGLYVDGTEAAKDTDFVGGMSVNGGLYFGADKTLEASSFFSGLIDDIRIYDEVLSAEEVAELAR